MTKDEARQLAQVAMALGSAAVAEALYDAWQKGRGAGLTEAASMATAQARVLRQAADPQHEADEGRRNNLARKAFAVEQVTRQIEARREVLHFVFCNKDPRRDYLAPPPGG